MKKKCLIIDDDEDDQEIFSMCVKQVTENVECVSMTDAVEAVAMLRTNAAFRPDYIFLDVNMPKMNGIDCLRLLKNMEQLKYTRIFMYSTTADGTSLADSRALGADDFIVKPARTIDLKEKLRTIFDIVSRTGIGRPD